MVRLFIEFEQNGSFKNPVDKSYYVNKRDHLTFILDSKKLKNLRPILLSNLPHKNKKNQFSQPKSPVIESNQTLSKTELTQNYTYFEGFFNKELSWQCNVEIEDFSGSLQFQIIFVDHEANSENLEIKSFGQVEWMIVNPQLKIKDKEIQLKQLVLQTVLPPQLGKSSNWLTILEESTNLKYNAFHFPPVQDLGNSQSLYSIKDQLSLNQDIFAKGEAGYTQLTDIISNLEKKHGCLSFVDILFNHTSSDSQWLVDCPGSYYNETNVPHLKSALVLDIELQNFSKKLSRGEVKGYEKSSIDNEEDLQIIMELVRLQVFDILHLDEYFRIDNTEVNRQFQEQLQNKGITLVATEYDIVEEVDNFFAKNGIEILEELLIANTKDIGADRFKVTVNLDVIIQVVEKNPEKFSAEAFVRAIKFVNTHWQNKVKQYVKDALNGIEGTIRWEHIEQQKFEVTDENPLVPPYFTQLSNGEYAANNGWIMNYQNVQENFAESFDFHYLRRSIVIWGDLIKLRYGNQKSDSKPLWKRMKKYVQTMAKTFHGFRIDNAHSTPLNVGEYFIRKARQVNHDLVVFAELFTGNPQEDALFVKRLGLNALVRETIHARESEHIYKHLKYIAQNSDNYIGTVPPLYEFDVEKEEKMQALVASIPLPLVYDQTHDNEPLIRQHSLPQMMSLIALNSFAGVFYGTVKGYDELYSDKVNVVNEKRLYREEGNLTKTKLEKEGYEVGIVYHPNSSVQSDSIVKVFGSFNNWKEGIECKKEGNVYIARLKIYQIGTFFYKFTVDSFWTLDEQKQEQEGNHYFTVTVNKNYYEFENLAPIRQSLNTVCKEIGEQYPQIDMEYHDYGVISITREHVSKHKSYMVISRTGYEKELEQGDFVNCSINCPGQLDRVVNIYTVQNQTQERKYSTEVVKDQKILQGQKALVREEFNIREFADLYYCPQLNKQVLHFYNMKPGTIIILECSLAYEQKEQIIQLNKDVNNCYAPETFKLYDSLKPIDINYLLYICDNEDWERNSSGLYQIPGKGHLKYAGLAGLFNDLIYGSETKNVELPIIKHVNEGNWLIDYIVRRLYNGGGERLQPIAQYFDQTFRNLKNIPGQHKAYYFFLTIKIFQEQIINKIYKDLQKTNTKDCFKSTFSKNLLLSTFQFIGESPSCQFDQYTVSIAAGLPHFSTGWSRAWGRDTFIAFRGLLLLPGMYAEAKSVILMFAATLRHGLIPNLLDGGRNSRFNNRDSCWWFIKAVKDYIEVTKDVSIWKEEVNMRFLDDSWEVHNKLKSEGKTLQKKLHDIVQDIFSKHANGIHFREWRAGPDIDSNMSSEGFNIQLGLEQQTGFIIGGNPHNCLTWMDKMGSSAKSGNKGVPATSRNGAPIELTALLKLCLDFVHSQYEKKQYPYKEVTIKETAFTFQQWSKNIQKNFEKYYWVPDQVEDYYDKKYAYITGMYKDVIYCKDAKTQYNLRPNSCIAIAVAPELFNKQNAISHMKKCEKYLVEEKSLGIKTLDTLSSDYIPYYANDDDSTRYDISHGFSYHNGPEWVWVYAFFLQALIQLKKDEQNFRAQTIMSYLANHKYHISHNEWYSLPEMTNSNGEYCKFSCPAQAWSVSCILEICYDLQQYKK